MVFYHFNTHTFERSRSLKYTLVRVYDSTPSVTHHCSLMKQKRPLKAETLFLFESDYNSPMQRIGNIVISRLIIWTNYLRTSKSDERRPFLTVLTFLSKKRIFRKKKRNGKKRSFWSGFRSPVHQNRNYIPYWQKKKKQNWWHMFICFKIETWWDVLIFMFYVLECDLKKQCIFFPLLDNNNDLLH